MGVKLRAFCWVLTAILFGYNCYLWGGLKDSPLIGAQLMREAPFDSPLAATYMFLGSKINGTIGQTEAASAYAARRFPEQFADPSRVEYLAVRRFLSAQGALGKLCYYLAPVLLVLSLVLHAMRQKKIRSLGSTG
jgi:hypothetical protein